MVLNFRMGVKVAIVLEAIFYLFQIDIASNDLVIVIFYPFSLSGWEHGTKRFFALYQFTNQEKPPSILKWC